MRKRVWTKRRERLLLLLGSQRIRSYLNSWKVTIQSLIALSFQGQKYFSVVLIAFLNFSIKMMHHYHLINTGRIVYLPRIRK